LAEISIYHNPKCSKSRQALELLKEKGYDPDVIEYLKTPPDAATLKLLLKKLGIGPRQVLRTKEAEYRELGLDDTGLSDEQIIDAIVNTPKLLERPIVVRGNQAAIGRPTEAILALLD